MRNLIVYKKQIKHLIQKKTLPTHTKSPTKTPQTRSPNQTSSQQQNCTLI